MRGVDEGQGGYRGVNVRVEGKTGRKGSVSVREVGGPTVSDDLGVRTGWLKVMDKNHTDGKERIEK